MTPTRDQAWRLLNEYTRNDRLLKHALAVEAAVRGYAREFGADEEDWGVVPSCTTSTTSAGRAPRTIRTADARSCASGATPST